MTEKQQSNSNPVVFFDITIGTTVNNLTGVQQIRTKINRKSLFKGGWPN